MRTFAIIKPDIASSDQKVGNVMSKIVRLGLQVDSLRWVQLTPKFVEAIYRQHIGRSYFAHHLNFMTAGPVLCMVLRGPGAVGKWREAMREIRVRYQTDPTQNCVHGSDSPDESDRELALYFDWLRELDRPQLDLKVGELIERLKGQLADAQEAYDYGDVERALDGLDVTRATMNGQLPELRASYLNQPEQEATEAEPS